MHACSANDAIIMWIGGAHVCIGIGKEGQVLRIVVYWSIVLGVGT